MVWKDKQLPGVEFIQKMALNFKSLNIYWLLTGDGDILNENEEERDSPSGLNKGVGVISKEYIKMQKEIEQLKDKLTNVQEKYINLLEKLYGGEGKINDDIHNL